MYLLEWGSSRVLSKQLREVARSQGESEDLGLAAGAAGLPPLTSLPPPVLNEAWARRVPHNWMQRTKYLPSTQLQMWHRLFIRVTLPPINSQAFWNHCNLLVLPL